LNLQPFYKQALYLAWWQSRVLPFSGFRLSAAPDELRMNREGAIATLHTVVDGADRMLRNRNLNMVYIHLPIPHPPGIWDSKKKALTTGESGYVDNLELADELLGRFRRDLEGTGDWDRTTVLVTADHPYRPEWASWYEGEFDNPKTQAITHGQWQPHIPFLVKLPYERHAKLYTRSFSSIVSGNLLLAALQGKIQTPEQAASWLDAHAEPHPGTANGVCLP
jgi:arylsulfatase A-like enzyme